MDNRMIDVTSEGQSGLEHALALIWPNAAGGRATHFRVLKLKEETQYFKSNHLETGVERISHHTRLVEDPSGVTTLILLWGNEDGTMPLPFPLWLESACRFVGDWLKEKEDAYGEEPDHDGGNRKGWRVFTNRWGHVFSHRYAICGIQPVWAMHGK